MPRRTKSPVVFLGLSPAASATALDIAPKKIYDAVKRGELEVRSHGTARRIWVGDLEKWFRKYWLPTKPRKVPDHAG